MPEGGNIAAAAHGGSVTPPLHILMLAPGSRGDASPLLAVCRLLMLDGHCVRFAAHEVFRADVEALNDGDGDGDSRDDSVSSCCATAAAPGHACPPRRDAAQHSVGGAASQPSRPCCRGNVIFYAVHGAPSTPAGPGDVAAVAGAAALEHWARQLADYSAAAAAAPPVDAVLFNWFGTAGVHLAESLGVPALALWPGAPLTRTRAFTCPLLPSQSACSAVASDTALRSYVMLEALLWRTAAEPINAWRTGTLRLPPMRDELGHFAAMARSRCPVLYGFSPRVVPPPTDFPARVIICGDWSLRASRTWAPPPRLRQFLECPGAHL